MKKSIDGKVSNISVSENKSKLYSGNKVKDSCNNCVDVDSTTMDTCPNTPITPVGIPGGVVVKVPVVLAEFTVRFNVNSFIKLPELALEIKDVKKRLKITQCMLLQPTNILFIKGFIRKNIDYSTRDCSNREGVCGDLRHCTVDVPFECSTPVTFTTPPAPLLTNTVSEFEYFKVSDLPNKYYAEKDNLLAGDLSEINQFRTENFNELPFCELITANLYAFDEFIGRYNPDCYELPFEEKLFNKLEEKIVVELTLKVLQNRQVSIGAIAGTADRC